MREAHQRAPGANKSRGTGLPGMGRVVCPMVEMDVCDSGGDPLCSTEDLTPQCEVKTIR